MIAAYLLLTAAAAWSGEDMSKADSRLVMRDFANCMAGHHSNDARAYLALDPSRPLTAEQAQLLRSDCMPMVSPAPIPVILGAHTPTIAIKGSRENYRFALAEALLLRTYRRSAPAIAPEAPPLSHPALVVGSPMPVDWHWDASEWFNHIKRSQQDALASAFGECVVRASPELSWTLLKTDVGSSAEAQAFEPLKPVLATCLGQTGGMAHGKFGIRGSIALNFYRLTMAAPMKVAAQ